MGKIPKIIHYCWFSSEEYPDLIKKCIQSWKIKLPDYEIKCWNTQNFNVNICQYTKEAYEAKKYAFVSDYVRLYALYHEGGIYLDSDIEVLKSFDPFLDQSAFTCFENNHFIAAWIFGSEKGNLLFQTLLDYYKSKHFLLPDGTYDLTPNPVPITSILVQKGLILNGELQNLKNITIFPQEYFNPYDRSTESINVTDNTYTIHYFNGSWISDKKKRIIAGRKKVIKKYGKYIGYLYYFFMLIRYEGIKQAMKEFLFFANNFK